MGWIIALISGALMSIQGVFNTALNKSSSLWVANSWVQFTAWIVCMAAWLFTGRKSFGQLWQVDNKLMLLGGVIGAFITMTVIKSMESLGPAQSVMLIVVSQIVVAYVIELLGIWGVEKQTFQLQKVIGLVLAIAGIVIFKWE